MKNFNKILLISMFLCSDLFANTKHESELSVVIVSGNEEFKTESFKHESIFSSDKIKLKLKGNYLHSLNSEIWDVSLRFDRDIYFMSYEWLGNNPKRSNLDLGLKYKYYEAGYRLQRENKESSHFLRLYTGFETALNLSKVKFSIEILPNILKLNEFQINAETSINIIISNLFSLRISYNYKFDNVDSRIDEIYMTSLVARY